MRLLPLGGNETHYLNDRVYVLTGDRITFYDDNKIPATSLPATRLGEVDMYRTRMLAELYKFTDGFHMVFKE